MTIEEDERYYSYIIAVLKTLHIQSDRFFASVARREPYESTIYQWITRLYHKGKSNEETIQHLYRMGRQLMIKR
ncbi:hypothetical protein [Aquimarina sp. MMG016]|uniref:hypothetical protein n=1 Tax=Aquimarina sp. MMG016 TaxID=2822690 RepID=UPI001B3A4D12|nr:hypothetical protein [Aquimarina sp. MMG016]MBQ4822108.1 hypothetical protein [Aquimarina sp. MMG016]